MVVVVVVVAVVVAVVIAVVIAVAAVIYMYIALCGCISLVMGAIKMGFGNVK